MINLYEEYPIFIDSDPRKERILPYRTTPEFMQTRHELIFKNISFQDKTVLDLGCCAGYTGAWALTHGAAKYYGVEFSKELYDIANNNFTKSFNVTSWELYNISIEEFLESNTQHFDIIIAMGVIYAFVDPVYFLRKLSGIGDVLVIESPHHREEDLDLTVLENSTFVSYSGQKMIYNDSKTDIMYYSARPSISLVRKILNFSGFAASDAENLLLMEQLPDHYQIAHNKRFALVAHKTGHKEKPLGYVSTIKNNEINKYRW